MTEHQASQLGIDASQVLENEAYKQAMVLLREQTVRQWKACGVRDKEGQLLCLQFSKLADMFEDILSGIVESGKFAARKIEKMNDLRNENPARKLMRRVL
jgi:hypothetical protein